MIHQSAKMVSFFFESIMSRKNKSEDDIRSNVAEANDASIYWSWRDHDTDGSRTPGADQSICSWHFLIDIFSPIFL